MNRQLAILIALAGMLFCGEAPAEAIDFNREIRPILMEHCIKCHNADRSESGLSLHSFEAAMRGGDSGKPVLGGTQETNELLRRVTSADPKERMPFEASALSSDEIDRLTRWVDQGTPWPETVQEERVAGRSTLSIFVDSWIRPYLFWYGGLLIAILLLERIKAKDRQGKIRHIGWPIYVAAVLALALGIAIHQITLLHARLEAKLTYQATSQAIPSIAELFGNPPVPIRPSHEPRLGGLYYRGNNERREELYNNGHYRTATLELSLVDRNGNALDYGARVPDELAIRLVIIRAPHATTQLFTETIMSGLLLATGFHPAGVTVPADKAVTFENIEPSERWQATFPVKIDGESGAGLIYLYRGNRIESNAIETTGMPQIGIVYELIIEDSKIAEGSELWLDAIYYPDNVLPPAQEGMLPWNEWFSYQPIPVIKGKNSSDPELLGITAPDGSQEPPTEGD